MHGTRPAGPREENNPVHAATKSHYDPQKVAPDTYIIRQLTGEGGPFQVYINSLVIRGKEPIIVDTGTTLNREQWLKDVFSLVDPKDVKWVYLSHDDHDHTGNLMEVLDLCPNATLVCEMFMVERLIGDYELPMQRMRWVNDGDTFDAGDRTFAAIRPPIFDSPTTRGLYDTKTGFYWGSDSFAAPTLGAVENVADLDPQFWADGFAQFQRMISPWFELVDPQKFAKTVRRIERMGVEQLASAHTAPITGDYISKAYEILYRLPSMEPVALPNQAELEAMLQAMNNGTLAELENAA